MASDPHFAGGGISQKLNAPYRLTQIVEHRCSTIE